MKETRKQNVVADRVENGCMLMLCLFLYLPFVIPEPVEGDTVSNDQLLTAETSEDDQHEHLAICLNIEK